MFYPWLVVCVPLLLKQKVGFNCEGPPHIVGSSLTMLVKRVFPSTHTHIPYPSFLLYLCPQCSPFGLSVNFESVLLFIWLRFVSSHFHTSILRSMVTGTLFCSCFTTRAQDSAYHVAGNH